MLYGDEETEGWPIVIAGVNNFLVFSHSVHLDVGGMSTQVCSIPVDLI
jgi:hypothetical protein